MALAIFLMAIGAALCYIGFGQYMNFRGQPIIRAGLLAFSFFGGIGIATGFALMTVAIDNAFFVV